MSDEESTPAAAAICTDCSGSGKVAVTHYGTGEKHTVVCPCKADLPIPFVWQPEDNGCGVAALAMVARLTYRQARQYFTLERDFAKDGMHVHELHEALNVLGFAYQDLSPRESRLGYTPRAEWPPTPFTDLAIGHVKNLRDSSWHFVVVLRGGRVLDPTWGIIQGLHRYPEVVGYLALYRVSDEKKSDAA